MESTFFNLNFGESTKDPISGTRRYSIKVPTLSAYCVSYTKLNIGSHTEYQLRNSLIEESELVIWCDNSLDLTNRNFTLEIYYRGIRDYELLFPTIKNNELKKRLAAFYREALIAYNNELKLCFMLMSGAIFEGLLYSKVDENLSFIDLIRKAENNNLIDEKTKNIIDKTRNFRNLVHANNHKIAYVQREDFMDTRELLESMIKKWANM